MLTTGCLFSLVMHSFKTCHDIRKNITEYELHSVMSFISYDVRHEKCKYVQDLVKQIIDLTFKKALLLK